MKSPTRTLKGPNEGPEEGEILSDDLEDISDESIIFTLNNGKSLSRSDHLHALSLSSVTDMDLDVDDEPPAIDRERRKRRKSYSQRHARRRKRSRRKTVDSDSSDNEPIVDRKLMLQLKAAVRRADIEEAHTNSLRTRLRAMVKGSSGHDTDPPETDPKNEPTEINGNVSGAESLIDPITIIDLIEQDTSSCIEILSDNCPEKDDTAPENVDSASEHSKGEEVDSELIQLRLAALKTAINNKFANRKKRLKNIAQAGSSDDTNKENTSNNSEENQVKKLPIGENKVESPQISPQTSTESVNNVPPSPDDDEDVLRALLLASMSKKITKIQPEPSQFMLNKVKTNMAIINQKKNMILNKMRTNNFKLSNNNIKRVLNNVQKVVNTEATKVLKMAPVKPLIINVNSDSDSDWDLSSSPEKSPQKPQKDTYLSPELSQVVEDLETVIANSKVECTDTNILQSVDNAIESSVDKFLRDQRAKVESQIKTTDEVNVQEVSVVPSVVPLKKSAPISPISMSDNKTTVKLSQSGSKTATPNTTPEKPKVQKAIELDKSALKFLPASKREEYKKLQNLLKLRKAQIKRPRVRRMSQKMSDISKNLKITVIGSSTNEGVASVNGGIALKGIQKSVNTPQQQVNPIKQPVIAKKAAVAQVANKTNKLIPRLIPTNPVSKQAPQVQQNSLAKITPITLKNTNTLLAKTSASAALSKAKPNLLNIVPVKKILSAKSTQTTGTNKVQLSPKVEAWLENLRNQELRAVKREQEKKKEAGVLRSTLKQLQTKKDGRLQIQEKYKSLRPLVKKLNEVSKEQKQWDQEVERLMSELNEARLKQEELHNTMSASVRNLADQKKNIDGSQARSVAINNKPSKLTTNIITSTPIKPGMTAAPLLSSSFSSSLSSVDTNDVITIESTTNHHNNQSAEAEASSIDKTLVAAKDQESLLDTWEQSTICNRPDGNDNISKMGESEIDINLVVDPNDIDNVIKKTEERVAVLEKKESFECRKSEKVRYVSPLDVGQRNVALDPFGIMCPFEVNGTCKDPECAFNHLPK